MTVRVMLSRQLTERRSQLGNREIPRSDRRNRRALERETRARLARGRGAGRARERSPAIGSWPGNERNFEGNKGSKCRERRSRRLWWLGVLGRIGGDLVDAAQLLIEELGERLGGHDRRVIDTRPPSLNGPWYPVSTTDDS